MAFNIESGDPQWLDALTRSSRFSAVSGLNDVSARPVVDQGTVFAVSVSGRMIAVREANGERLWTRNVASAHTPVVAGDAVYVVTLEGDVIALSRSTGDPQWVTALPRPERGRISFAGPVLAGNRLFIASNRGDLISVSPANGQILGTRPINDDIGISPIVAGGRLYMLGNNGGLSAYN